MLSKGFRRNLGEPVFSSEKEVLETEDTRPEGEAQVVGSTHSVCLAAQVSGGLKSHSTRGPGSISKGGGNASPGPM
jgi:hypothetical protein